jgi:hypothetical protein
MVINNDCCYCYFDTIDGVVFSIIVLVTIYGLFGFIFCQRYLFNSRAIFSNYVKFKLKLVSISIY